MHRRVYSAGILKREGVDVLFGYPGGAVVIFMMKCPKHPEIRHILTRHERGAVHAADGYARASGQETSCNFRSRSYQHRNRHRDRILRFHPLVVITGQVPTPLIGNDAFQEVDIVGITRPCTKHNFLVKNVEKLALTIRQAFFLARSGRPGPVLVDVPKDVIQAVTEFVWPEEISMRSYNPTYKPNIKQLLKAVDVLARSKRPVILCGGGVILSNASNDLRELARKLDIPVASTLMGLGSFPQTIPFRLEWWACTEPTRQIWP